LWFGYCQWKPSTMTGTRCIDILSNSKVLHQILEWSLREQTTLGEPKVTAFEERQGAINKSFAASKPHGFRDRQSQTPNQEMSSNMRAGNANWPWYICISRLQSYRVSQSTPWRSSTSTRKWRRSAIC
jgi:hypothetical protein